MIHSSSRVEQKDQKERALKLALTGAVKETIVEEGVLADYLLYSLNRMHALGYVEAYGLPGPCDEIVTVLEAIARKLGFLSASNVPDVHAAARAFLSHFRSGKLGHLTLDDIPLIREG
eukprot:TRINITY_DN15984_c0_g1_i1.p1 TRINITY_DN15984_c0_g1~~TRINITY_DN15984_c0_g1_i1.p1  ORF type:complete len:125 (-),score=23.91 TRINITY_DN15984_c0_g1_i1:221-574(-)